MLCSRPTLKFCTTHPKGRPVALTDISHPTDIAMLTDLYELTMAQGLWESGKANEQGCFTAFYRDHPFGSAYAVMCGTAELPELVENLRFTPEDIDYLASLQAPAGGAMFKPAFLDYLRNFRAHVNIDAVPEGELVFPREPMVRVTGPSLECQLLETALLNIVGFQTNLKWGEQKRVFSMIPGLEHAEFVRYGVMHRNTFLESPKVLTKQQFLKEHPNVFFAGQITGFEGYMESAASGLLAAHQIFARLKGRELPPPPAATMCGALLDYITTPNKDFQPMGANMGILPRTEEINSIRDKRERYMALSQAAQDAMQAWVKEYEA